jgi:hypothetical protein
VAQVPEDYTVLVVPHHHHHQQQQQQQQQQLLPSNKTVTVYTKLKGQRRTEQQLTVPHNMNWQQFYDACGAAVGLRADTEFVLKIEGVDGIDMVRALAYCVLLACAWSLTRHAVLCSFLTIALSQKC